MNDQPQTGIHSPSDDPTAKPKTNRFADCDSIEQVVNQAVGAGSMCWQHVDRAGVFESEQAAAIAQDALAEVRRRAFLTDPAPSADELAELHPLKDLTPTDPPGPPPTHPHPRPGRTAPGGARGSGGGGSAARDELRDRYAEAIEQ